LVEPDGRPWEFAFRLSYFGFVAARVVAILVVFRLLLRWLADKTALRD
jgi:hypothetical protein